MADTLVSRLSRPQVWNLFITIIQLRYLLKFHISCYCSYYYYYYYYYYLYYSYYTYVTRVESSQRILP